MSITQLPPLANTAVPSALFHFVDIDIVHHVVNEIVIKPVHLDQIIPYPLSDRHRLADVLGRHRRDDKGCPEQVHLAQFQKLVRIPKIQ